MLIKATTLHQSGPCTACAASHGARVLAGYPCFLDIEASSFSDDSWPLEVAWSDRHGAIHRCLVSPETVPEWTDWGEQAEDIHGLDRDRLIRNGWEPAYVAARLEEDLSGELVYTDAPDFDERWLRRLFDAVKRPLPFRFEHVDELLLTILRSRYTMVYEAMLAIDRLKEEVGSVSDGKHSAGYDVGYLLQLWRRANGHAVKMNHGIGPMPDTTNTGTFIRLKTEPGESANPEPETEQAEKAD